MTGRRFLGPALVLSLLTFLHACSDETRDSSAVDDLTAPKGCVRGEGSRDGDTPFVHMFLTSGGVTVPMTSEPDTVGFGSPFTVSWEGHGTAAGLDPTAALAEVDSIGPLDGLLGFQWGLPGVGEAEWWPRMYDEATGDTVPYYSALESVTFLNNGSSAGPTGQVLPAGQFDVLARAIDLAGEVAMTSGSVVHNHDPDTRLLNDEMDPIAEHQDPMTYPYYVVWHGPEAGVYSFSAGDTVPDGAYVVFKALGWDDQRDEPQSAENLTRFQGRFEALGLRYGTVPFAFASTFSVPNQTPAWTAEQATGVSADTLGFEVGPFTYDVTMRAVDEHDTRDGTAPGLSFQGNFPPCVQCVEFGGYGFEPADYNDMSADNCWDGACLDEEHVVNVYSMGDPRYQIIDDDGLAMHQLRSLWVNPATGQLSREEVLDDGWYSILSAQYAMVMYLHGKDHPREHWREPFSHNRIKGWRYQIDYEADVTNEVQDGPGLDDLGHALHLDISENVPDPMVSDLFITEEGVWGMRVMVDVPHLLLLGGESAYWHYLQGVFDCLPFPVNGTEDQIREWQGTPEVRDARASWDLTLMQLSPGTIQVVARDQATCEGNPMFGGYHVYDGTRMPSEHGRSCIDGQYDANPEGIVELANITLVDFAAESDGGQPTSVDFKINAYQPGADVPFEAGMLPPGWLGD